MKFLILIILLSSLSSAQTLQLLEVVPNAGEGIEKMPFEDGHLFVKTKPIISDPDVETAAPSELNSKDISVRLNPAGGQKLKAVTSRMAPGQDRIALVIAGSIVTAPTVNGVVSRDFILEGLNDLSAEEVDDLARKISARPARKAKGKLSHIGKFIPPKKSIPQVPGLLKSAFKNGELPKEDWSTRELFENLMIPDPAQKVNLADLSLMITIVAQLASDQNNHKTEVDPNCDLMKTLAHNFPEVRDLRKIAGKDKIDLNQIHLALEPYRSETKSLHDLIPKK